MECDRDAKCKKRTAFLLFGSFGWCVCCSVYLLPFYTISACRFSSTQQMLFSFYLLSCISEAICLIVAHVTVCYLHNLESSLYIVSVRTIDLLWTLTNNDTQNSNWISSESSATHSLQFRMNRHFVSQHPGQIKLLRWLLFFFFGFFSISDMTGKWISLTCNGKNVMDIWNNNRAKANNLWHAID